MKFETRAVLAAAYPRIGGSNFLTHTVELEDGIPVGVVCRRVKLDSLADRHAVDPTAPPTCARCLQGWRVRQVKRIKRDRDERGGRPVVDPDLVRREAEASMRLDEGFTTPAAITPEEILDALRDIWLTRPREAKLAIIATAIRAAEERGIEEAARLCLQLREEEGVGLDAAYFAKRIRALKGNARASQHQANTKRDTE